jgi:hypothetical protein
MKYYKVLCPRGHVGSGKSAEIVFYFKAKDLPSALAIARKMPSVKHNTRKEFFSGKEVTKEEYYENMKISAYERYKTYRP